MNTRLIKTLQQVRELLEQAPALEPGWESKDECYQWVEQTLKHFRYRTLGRSDKGLIPILPSKHELRSHSEPLELRWNSSQ